MSRSGELTDLLIQIVSKKPMPDIRQRLRPPFLRPLSAGKVRKLSDEAFANLIENLDWESPEEMFNAPVWNTLNCCVPNAFLNCFKANDEKTTEKGEAERIGKAPDDLRKHLEGYFFLELPTQEQIAGLRSL